MGRRTRGDRVKDFRFPAALSLSFDVFLSVFLFSEEVGVKNRKKVISVGFLEGNEKPLNVSEYE
jgi:hypothetical protein